MKFNDVKTLRRSRFLLLLALAGAFSSQALGADKPDKIEKAERIDRDWNTYQPGNNACSIKFPSNPEYQTQQADGMIVHVYIAKDPAQTPPGTYALSFGDFAKGRISDERDAAAHVLDSERNNFIKAVNGKLLSEKSSTVENYPGREIVVASEDGKSRFIVREYLAGSRIFHLIAWAPLARGENAAADATKFFDSFQTGTK